jgi:hypothetical protein
MNNRPLQKKPLTIGLYLSLLFAIQPYAATDDYRCIQCDRKKERQEKIINAAVTSAVTMINALIDIKLNNTTDADDKKQKISSHATACAASIGGIILASIRSALPDHRHAIDNEHSDDLYDEERIQALITTIEHQIHQQLCKQLVDVTPL